MPKQTIDEGGKVLMRLHEIQLKPLSEYYLGIQGN